MGEVHSSGRLVNRLARRKVIAVALASAALLVITATALAATGDLTQPAGTAGCISETGRGLRRRPRARQPVLGGGEPGREERLRRLERQQRRGAPQPQHDHRGDHPARRDRRLRQRDGGACADGHGLDSPYAVAVSPDGKSVYVASDVSDAVARFNRAP